MTNLLDLMQPPAIARAVDCALGVVEGEPDETLRLEHPKMAWDRATIELHQHTDGLWMWSTSAQAGTRGFGYRIGPKWGKFAPDRASALHWAIKELTDQLDGNTHQDADTIRAWTLDLK